MENKNIGINIQITGLKELSDKLNELNECIKKAISIAEEIAELDISIAN